MFSVSGEQPVPCPHVPAATGGKICPEEELQGSPQLRFCSRISPQEGSVPRAGCEFNGVFELFSC